MKQGCVVFSVAFAFCVQTGVSFGAALTSADYVSSGLAAQWDGIEYAGRGIPRNYFANWCDIVGGRTISLNNYMTANSTPYGVYFGGSSAYWGSLKFGDRTLLAPREEGITVEVVFTFADATANATLFTGDRASGVCISRTSAGLMVFGNDGVAAQATYSPAPENRFAVFSVGYTNGVVAADHVFIDGAAVELNSEATSRKANDEIYIVRDSVGDYAKGLMHAVRVYHRLLTAEEAAKNHEIDVNRFTRRPAFDVVSGTVTVDGVEYGAGRGVFSAQDGAVTVSAASGAVIAPNPDGLTRLTVEAGDVAFASRASGALTYLKELTLGAGVTVTVPTTGLDAGLLTADATAKAGGSGVLVAAAAEAPVTLEGEVTYLPATGGFAGWPTSGTAYVPAGATAAIATAADVAAVAGLDRIAFLDDGTDAAKSSAVSYTAAEPLTLSAKLCGPGVFSAVAAGGLTVVSDNADFTGNFHLENLRTTVTRECGLGSSLSRAAELVQGLVWPRSATFFENGGDVFTNRAPLSITCGTATGCKSILGPAAPEKTLVQAAQLTYPNVEGDSFVYLTNNVTLLQGYNTRETVASRYPRLAPIGGGKVVVCGEICQGSAGHFFVSGPGVTFANNGYKGGDVNPYYDIRLAHADAFLGANLVPMNSVTVDLDGYDQVFGYFAAYNGVSQSEEDTKPLMTLTSETPATLTMRTAKSFITRPKFSGRTNFRYAATSAAATNVFARVESDTTGELRVEGGTLILRSDYAWKGTNVTVTGGSLVLDSARALPDGTAALAVTGGTLAIRSGAAATVASAAFGGRKLEDGVYSVADLRAMEDVAPFIGADADDGAQLVVSAPDPTEWHGWPAGGGTVAVPKGMTVYITDDDVEKVAALEGLDIHVGARVVAANLTKELVLKANVIGLGTFDVADSATVVIVGDNSGLLAPGGFSFTRTDVVVSNRFGLGGALTGPCKFSTPLYAQGVSGREYRLVFSGPAKTNDTAVVVDNGMAFGYDDHEVNFVQNANFTQTAGSTWAANRVALPGDITFAKDFRASYLEASRTVCFPYGSTVNGTSFYQYQQPGTSRSGTRVFFFGASSSPGGTKLRFDGAEGSFFPDQFIVQTHYHLYFTRPYTMDIVGFCGVYNFCTYHLDGTDQRIGAISQFSGDNWTVAAPSVFTSATPATLYARNTVKDEAGAFKVSGQVSLDYSGPRTQQAGHCACDTTGTLAVRSGRLVMDYGSYWGGTNVTVAGGTLEIGEFAVTNSFFASRKAVLDIDNGVGGGTLIIPAGRTEKVRAFRVDGEFLESGTYGGSASGLDAAHTLPALGVSAGRILVRQSDPSDPGALLIVR